MASTKLVWVPCAICDGTGEESVTIPSWAGGYTTYKTYANECTNCQGDKGHRMPVLAPDPDKEVVNPQIKQPDWWVSDPLD